MISRHNIVWNLWPYKRMANGEKLSPYIIKEPSGWEQVKAYAKTDNYDDRPCLETVRAAFSEGDRTFGWLTSRSVFQIIH